MIHQRSCRLFLYDRFWTNGKLNAGILPGESGYAILRDPAEWGAETAANHLIERTNIKQGGIQVRPVTEIPSPGPSSWNHQIGVEAFWEGAIDPEIIPLRMSLNVKGSSGEILLENQQVVDPIRPQPILLTTNTDMTDWSEIRVDYSFPSWEELTDEEKSAILEMMEKQEFEPIYYQGNVIVHSEEEQEIPDPTTPEVPTPMNAWHTL